METTHGVKTKTSENGCILLEDIKQSVLDRTAAYKVSHWVEFVKEIPKGPTGKIQRSELR